jgi:hypothetical protein
MRLEDKEENKVIPGIMMGMSSAAAQSNLFAAHMLEIKDEEDKKMAKKELYNKLQEIINSYFEAGICERDCLEDCKACIDGVGYHG